MFPKRPTRTLMAWAALALGLAPLQGWAQTAGEKTALADQQRQIAEKYKRLEDVLLRMAELGAEDDPRRAALLKKAVAQSKDRLIAVRMDQLVELLDKDQFARVLEGQVGVDRDLRAILELLLTENRQKRLETEKTRLREQLQRLGALLKQEKDLQARTLGGDDAQRLAEGQKEVSRQTGRLAQDVLDKAAGGGGKAEGETPPAHKRLEDAKKRMDQAEARLRDAQRQAAGEHQEEAIRRLQQAKADLEEILRQLREEEIGRTLAMLETRFRKMLDLQQEVYDGTVRLDAVPQPQRTAGHPIEASRLGGQERQIVAEADKALALLREDGGAASFGEATEQMRDDMQQIAERLARARVGRLTQDIEQDVLAALREMLDALAKAQKDLAAKKTPAGKPSSVEMVEPPLVDRLSELRMIRALQMRVNRRTDQYAKRIDGPQATDPDLREALGRLAERQRQIHRVTRELETGGNP